MERKVLQDKCMGIGAALSCKTLERFSTALELIPCTKGPVTLRRIAPTYADV